MIELQRKSPVWWDELHVPADIRPAHLFTWLEEVAPMPEEHDYVLSTDGSGCTRGWGASASIIQKVEPGGALGRVLGKYHPLVSGTYGSTVQRREFHALLDGLHEILRIEASNMPELDSEFEGLDRLLYFSGERRITVLWYTDRGNLAKSLLFNEDGQVLNKRTTERDLWLRFSAFARAFCITPMWTERNLIPAQKACDELCDIARKAMLAAAEQFKTAAGAALHDQWNQPISQKAVF